MYIFWYILMYISLTAQEKIRSHKPTDLVHNIKKKNMELMWIKNIYLYVYENNKWKGTFI